MANATPWIGSRYTERRVLILAESSWGVALDDADYVAHWIEHPAFLKHPECPTCVACGRACDANEKDYPRDRLNDALTRMMLNWQGETTDKNRREEWSRIAFTNFILRTVHDLSAKARPTDADWREAAAALPGRLASLAPRAVLVLDSPSGRLLTVATPLIEAAGAKAVRLAHLTMRPAPTLDARAAAWAAACKNAS